MTTAAKLVNDALEMLHVASTLNPPEPEQQDRTFATLQDMIQEFNADQTDVWASYPNDINDELLVKVKDVEGLVNKLLKKDEERWPCYRR